MSCFPARIPNQGFLPGLCLLWALAAAVGTALPASAGPGPGHDATPSMSEMAGTMLMAGFRGLEVEDGDVILGDIRERHLGGVVLFDYDVELQSPVRNVAGPDQLARLTAHLQAAAGGDLIIAVDQEGGRVSRLKPRHGFARLPSAAEVGHGGAGAARKAGVAAGKMLAGVGINMNLAPVVDLDAGESSPAIGGLDRALAADAREAARLAGAYIRGLHEAGVAGCLKHFPGHGRAGGDTHEGLVDVTGTWGEDELVPYALLIEEGLADAVMTAHVYNRKWDEKRPATLTPGVVTGMLRCGLGFSGVVFTDDMQMGAVAAEYGFEEAVRLAVKAGADILVYGNNLEYDPEAVARAHGVIMEMVESGEVSRERIEASWERISALKAKITGR